MEVQALSGMCDRSTVSVVEREMSWVSGDLGNEIGLISHPTSTYYRGRTRRLSLRPRQLMPMTRSARGRR